MTDVGLGICGLEGRQVVMASDFVMEQFCFVKKSLIRRGTGTISQIQYQYNGHMECGILDTSPLLKSMTSTMSTWYSTHYWFLPL
uniref:Uncharacterized protein n=1 Tax=Aegilops tauschii subsp. strangulata TaxID=200361 RepID=A0A453K5N7_AEGTS